MSVRTQNLRPTFNLTRAAMMAVAVNLTLGGCSSLSGLGGIEIRVQGPGWRDLRFGVWHLCERHPQQPAGPAPAAVH